MNLNELIKKAEEKLRHENKKKIQTKLKLDQMVLRGVSAMNLEALKLAQNSLQGIIIFNLFIIILDVFKTDYKKDIEKMISNLVFAETRGKLKETHKAS